MNDKMSEFERFCESYIQAAEEEWGKSEDAVDLTAATVAKIMLNKYRQCHEATEPLAVLADRKGCSLTKRIELVNWLEGDDKKTVWHEFTGPTYSACEAKARAFLMGLPDKGEIK